MTDIIKSYTHPSYIFDGKIYHQLQREVQGVKRATNLYVWFQADRVRRKGTTCGNGYVRVQVLQKESPDPDTPWGTETVSILLNYVSVTALNTKGMTQKEVEGFGWAGSEEVAEAALQVQELVEDVDVPHLLDTMQKNAQYAERYATIIEEEVPDYLIIQSLAATDDNGIVNWKSED